MNSLKKSRCRFYNGYICLLPLNFVPTTKSSFTQYIVIPFATSDLKQVLKDPGIQETRVGIKKDKMIKRHIFQKCTSKPIAYLLSLESSS